MSIFTAFKRAAAQRGADWKYGAKSKIFLNAYPNI
jgi:hypothetical protein